MGNTHKVGRNDRCPCGSGEKYKNCYEKQPSQCGLFQKEKKGELISLHADKDDKVFRFFREAMEDIGSVFRLDDQKRDMIAQRAQLISVFTFIDVLASYWYEYLGKSGTQQERFLAWCDKYCFVDGNPEYKDDLSKLTSTRLYPFRCSMVHFLGISSPSEGNTITIAPNDSTITLLDKWRKGLKERGHEVLLIRPKALHNLVLEGAIRMLDEWRKNIDDSHADEAKKMEHVEGIDRIFRKIMVEGAVKVALEKRPEQDSSNTER